MTSNRTFLAVLTGFAILALTTGCTSTLQIEVLTPAEINVSQDINSISLVNRYLPEKRAKLLNVVEGLVTGEGIGTDRRGAIASLQGLEAALSGSPRFNATFAAVDVKGSGLGFFPEPLSSEKVMEICRNQGTDALITIEAFDSDNDIDYTSFMRKRRLRDGRQIEELIHSANSDVSVTVGWRMYDGKTGRLIDEFRMVEHVNFRGDGRSQELARQDLPRREAMVQRCGEVTGSRYAFRISPTWINVDREWYTKGNDQLKNARYKVEVGSWDEASELWVQGLDDSKKKLAGRCAYNLALASEVKGDLAGAIEWTKKSYGDYHFGPARAYQQLLENRLWEQGELKQQLRQ